MRRFALGVQYQGTEYSGWQFQPQVDTIQYRVEQALSKVANSSVKVICAGRTDAGVHAINQIIHFDSDADRQEQHWLLGGNQFLPHNISIAWVKEVSDQFHARFSAIARSYLYIIDNSPTPHGLNHGRTTWVKWNLDERLMDQAAQTLVGEHDFTSFRARGCQAKTPVKQVAYAHVNRHHYYIVFKIKADAFLYHMVRNIMGTLIDIGVGVVHPSDIPEIFLAKSRNAAGDTAPSSGLYLQDVEYDSCFALPSLEMSSPLFII